MPATSLDLISSQELCDAARVTYRQLDYWVRNGIITPTVDASGSGSRRGWDPDLVPKVALLGNASRLLNDPALFHELAANYERGRLSKDGLSLEWRKP